MKIRNIIALLALPVSAWAQTTTNLPAFTGIELNAPFKVALVHSTVTKATAVTGVELMVKRNILHIEQGTSDVHEGDSVIVYYTQLNRMEINGIGEISMAQGSTINADTFKLECNGAAKTNLNMEVKFLRLEGNGESIIKLAGNADKVKAALSGVSKLYAAELKTRDMNVEGSGASYFAVFASNSLHVDATNATKGSYAGKPVIKNINVSGVSSIVDASTGEEMSDERSGNGDTTRLTIGKMKVIIIDEDKKQDTKGKKEEAENGNSPKKIKRYDLKHVYAGFEVGVNNFASSNLQLNVPANYSYLSCNTGRSWFYGLNFIEKDAQIIKNKLAITTGFGIEFQHFEFASDKVLQANMPGVIADSGLVQYSRNRLYNFNLNVPLLLKFAPRNKKVRNGFHLAAGLIGTYKTYSSLSLETTARGFKEETKIKDDFNINPFRVAATIRVGYGWFRAFASYSLTPYFKQTNGNPDIRVFAAGITLVPFQ